MSVVSGGLFLLSLAFPNSLFSSDQRLKVRLRRDTVDVIPTPVVIIVDDIALTAFWYQAEPHAPFPELPDAIGLEVV